MYKLFSDLGVNGKLWLAIKDLYTDVKAWVLYSGALSRELEASQGAEKGRILAPFMCKVYINSLLKELSGHCFAISINTLRVPASLFADDICLIALHQSLQCGSFASNISDNIDKTRKKAGMIFSSNVDRCKTNTLIYVTF